MNSLPPRHLVIFGCGYVGTAVATEALQRGWRVVALTRNETTATVLRAAGIEVVVADLATDAWHGAISSEAAVVLNCVSSGGQGLESYRRSYVEGMGSILAWTQKSGPVDTLVYTSSTSVYPQDAGATVEEGAATHGASERADLLLEAEARLQKSFPVSCARWFILRLAGIYGPGRHHLIDQVRSGEVAGLGGHHLNLIHRDDIVTAIWALFLAARECRNEIFNVVDDEPALKADVVAWLSNRLGLPLPRFTGQPAGGRRAVTPDRLISNRKLKNLPGWHPSYPTFRDGYEKMLSR